ncbi:hypothetical protein PF007_g8836 [Phytophthora fragariae]|uniref:Uncharacterized protein n=1 Tax=Phytophthora fragariae TaxID=53985 RepID=A0A6A3F3M9_9STRA|nr:hypothetical protein PF009_g11155 [Phytophthora fragariae]KAE9118703.1 hypothetical protein PF007_g8836 [Phytophthora fragariae]KAE9147189.1 hypothetical protein PF006_g8108 [Phytophthora fragariae]
MRVTHQGGSSRQDRQSRFPWLGASSTPRASIRACYKYMCLIGPHADCVVMVAAHGHDCCDVRRSASTQEGSPTRNEEYAAHTTFVRKHEPASDSSSSASFLVPRALVSLRSPSARVRVACAGQACCQKYQCVV